MKKSGRLSVTGNESRLDDGTLLASCAASDPLAAGTAFLANKGLEDGDDIWVAGNDGTVGNVSAFCMNDGGRQVPAAMLAEVPALRATRKAKKKPSQKKASTRKRRKKIQRRSGNHKGGKRS